MITWNTQHIKKADDSLMLLGFKGKFILYSIIVIGCSILLSGFLSLFFSPSYTILFLLLNCLFILMYMTDKYRRFGQYGLDKKARMLRLSKGIRNSIKIINILTN